MKISEIFISVQGEGPLLGRPAVFLRLAGCNLACTWCDTTYARTPRFVWDSDKTAIVLSRLLKRFSKLLVITGGEPLLQANELRKMLLKLRELVQDIEVQIETNATLSIRPIEDLVDIIVASPKLSNSGVPEKLREVHSDFIELSRKTRPILYLKFVIESEKDIEEMQRIVTRLSVPPERVYLMPQCRNIDEQLRKLPMVTKLAIKFGYCVSPRLHILARVK